MTDINIELKFQLPGDEPTRLVAVFDDWEFSTKGVTILKELGESVIELLYRKRCELNLEHPPENVTAVDILPGGR